MNSVSTTSSVMQSASVAINRAVRALGGDAQTVASAPITAGEQLLPALLDSHQQLLYTKAAAKLIETTDQMMGSLLDVEA